MASNEAETMANIKILYYVQTYKQFLVSLRTCNSNEIAVVEPSMWPALQVKTRYRQLQFIPTGKFWKPSKLSVFIAILEYFFQLSNWYVSLLIVKCNVFCFQRIIIFLEVEVGRDPFIFFVFSTRNCLRLRSWRRWRTDCAALKHACTRLLSDGCGKYN